ncbi:MAG: hypothetical protein ABIR92_09045 [Gemmatimonadaceae bacterium]
MRRTCSLAFVIACAMSAGCERRDRLAAPDSASAVPPKAQPQRVAYLSVSDLAPEPGATVLVAGTLGVGDTISLGSYRVRLAYDTTRLTYVGEVTLPGMFRVVNPKHGAVIVVGASPESSSDGRLFTLRFRVDDAAGLESLLLHIDELNDGQFSSQMQTVTRSSRLVLDRGLVRR